MYEFATLAFCLELRNYRSYFLLGMDKNINVNTWFLKLAHLYTLSFAGKFSEMSRYKKTMQSYLEG